jgi:hypothetical protein
MPTFIGKWQVPWRAVPTLLRLITQRSVTHLNDNVGKLGVLRRVVPR